MKVQTIALLTALGINSWGYDCREIQAQINNAKETQTTVIKLKPGTYVCSAPVVINKNNVVLTGAGQGKTKLELASGVFAPVLVIGSAVTAPSSTGEILPSRRVENVRVADLTIDGRNDLNHPTNDTECYNAATGKSKNCDGDVASIRNNGITIRGASHIQVENVTSTRNLSGGLVTEKGCSDLLVRNFTSTRNYFDGLAGYQTVNSKFYNLNLSENLGAGVSLDIDFNSNTMKNLTLHNNGDVGIFMRHIHGNTFEQVSIKNSGNFGVFAAAADVESKAGLEHTCAKDNTFKNFAIDGVKAAGIRIGDNCPGNKAINVKCIGIRPHLFGKTQMQECLSEAEQGILTTESAR